MNNGVKRGAKVWIAKIIEMIFLDIFDFRRVLFHAADHIIDMHIIQLQKFAFYHSCRIDFTSNQDAVALTDYCFQNQFKDTLYQFFIKLICLD